MEEHSYEKKLIIAALIICALLIGYNVFSSSRLKEPVIVVNGSDWSTQGENGYSNALSSGGTVSFVDSSQNMEPVSSNTTVGPPVSTKININTASKTDLCSLSGIGEVIAQRIIDYRTQQGIFHSIEELKNIKGIGDNIFSKISAQITVGNQPALSSIAPSITSFPVKPSGITSKPPLSVATSSSIPSVSTPIESIKPNSSAPAAISSTVILPMKKININTATQEELCSLNGIGEVISQRIIEYREQHDGFQSIEELKQVKGIGDKTFEKLKNDITI